MFGLVERRQEWDSALRELPQADFFHRFDYLNLEARRLGGRAVLVRFAGKRGTVALPLILRKIPGDLCLQDAVSAYGYAGLLESTPGIGSSESLWEELRKRLASLGIVSVFSRSHPFISANPPATAQAGETLALSLRQGVSEYERGLNSGHREEIRKLRPRVVIERGTQPRQLSHFYDLYISTMHRRRASPSYLFSESYVKELVDMSGPDSSIDLAWFDGQLAAACFFIRTPSLVHYHLSASNPQVCRYPATKLLIDEAVRGEIALGKREWLHLGGGLGGQRDTLYAFKAGFGASPRPFSLTKWVLNPVAYERLAASGQTSSSGGFFPAYRSSEL